MAQDREVVPRQTLQADPRQVDGRWPVPCAMMFVTALAVSLWSLIIAAASWLIG